MKKNLLIFFIILLLFSLTACGKTNSAGSSNPSNTNSKEVTNDSSKKNARISFDLSDKSSRTYKEHVEDLWSKTKVLWNEDTKKNYSDEEYMNLGKEIDEAWVNLQAHTSIPTNGHDQSQDTSDNVLGNMAGDLIGDTDKIYGQRSQFDTKEEREGRRKIAITNLSSTIKKYDDKLAKLTLK